MNFLAHLYLSGNDDFIKIGNFMADGIRGKDYQRYPKRVQLGVLLHRAIDTFTDHHTVFRQGKHRLHERYHHYSGVLMDMYYDHFLAKNWHHYHAQPLEKYAVEFYQLLHQNESILSPRTLKMLAPMENNNWLVQYATLEGLKNILTQMDHRSKYQSGMSNGVGELLDFYEDYQNEFTLFFEDMILYCQNWMFEHNEELP